MFCICLQSCREIPKSPAFHDNEIKDAVRYQIAFEQSIANQVKTSRLGYDAIVGQYSELDEKIQTLCDNPKFHSETACRNAYRYAVQALTYSNYRYRNYAQDILDCYDSLNVTLSNYKEIQPGQQWLFQDSITNITFSYTIPKTRRGQQYTWAVEPDEDSLEDYQHSLLLH